MSLFRSLFSFFQDPEYRMLLFTTALVLTLGTVVYHYLESWTWLDSLYFSLITLTTIGYGDFSPQTDGGKIFTIFYIIVGVGIILAFINTVYNHYQNRLKSSDRNEKKGG